MPEFADPFVGNVPRKLTRGELIRAIRLNITAEHEAVHLYTAHAEATDDPLAKKVLYDVADEERVHIGEFQRLLSYLAPDEDELVGDGVREVEEMKAELSIEGDPTTEVVEEVEAPVSESEEDMEEDMEEDTEEEKEEEIESAKTSGGIITIGSLID